LGPIRDPGFLIIRGRLSAVVSPLKDRHMHDFLPPGTRRHLLRRITALASGRVLLPNLLDPAVVPYDGKLLTSCSRFAELEQQAMGFYQGPRRIEDDDQREDRLSPLIAQQVELLRTIAAHRAAGVNGCQVKAAVWTLWNAGELHDRAIRHGLMEDVLLVSILADVEALP